MKCPNCGAESSGAFCAECGAPVKDAHCRKCAAALIPGASFCTSCGAALRSGAEKSPNPAWMIAGATLVTLILVLLWPTFRGKHGEDIRADRRVPFSQMEGIGGEGGDAAPGPTQAQLTGTPREQADRLFNRVMTERSGGDTARAKFFVPMAIQAYQMAEILDADGLYHLSLLQAVGGNNKAARVSAERILQSDPKHLLGLAAAADAARATGDNVGARKYYARFLAAYDNELKTTKGEYKDHGQVLPVLKRDAEAFMK